MQNRPDYVRVLTKEDLKEANKIFLEIWKKTDIVCKYHGLSAYTKIDENILRDVVIDYITAIRRLKVFHEIEEINKPKFWAYIIFWYCRRKPIQVIGAGSSLSNQDLLGYVNEFVIVTMFANEILEKRGLYWDTLFEKQREFFYLLIYNLRYRVFTEQSLELALTGFCCN